MEVYEEEFSDSEEELELDTEVPEKQIDWDELKQDVSLKNLVAALDRGVKKRLHRYRPEDIGRQEDVRQFKQWYNRVKILKVLALGLYILLPIFERPAWCINNPDIATSGHGYWYCQNTANSI